MAGVPGLVLPEPGGAHWSHVWHQFVVRHPKRDALQSHLEAAGIDTLVHYPIPPHLSGAYASLGLDFPIAARLAREVLSLPIDPFLSEDEAGAVIAAVKSFR